MKIKLTLVVFIFVISCKKAPNKHDIISSFPSEFSINEQSITAFDDAIGAIAIYTTENYIILQKRKTDYFFSVYLKKDLSHQMDMCRKGEGPDDFLAPIYLEQSENDNIWVLDRLTSIYYNISLNKSVAEGKTIVNKKVDFKPILEHQLRDMFIISNDIFLYSVNDKDCSYYKYDMKYKTNTKVENNYELSSGKNSSQLLQKISVYNSERHKFASMYYLFPKAIFSSTLTGAFRSILYADKDINMRESNFDNLMNSCTYFSCIKGTPDHVYYLYNDECSNQDATSSILVFDWSGNPIKIYNLSEKYTSFAIDQKLSKMYVLNYEKESNIISCFDIAE